jgi:hypothetical protein
MENVKEALQRFTPITLEEMDSVKLMNRTDTKFIFHISRFCEILNTLLEDYKVLEINGTRMCSYETLYYDTESLDLYMKHHNGRVNRYKVRCRKYVESDLYFLEIKHKNNKSRTIKNRIKLDDVAEVFKGKAKKFIEANTDINSALLKPICWVNYSRITLVNKNMQERVTLDLNLTLKAGQSEKIFDSLVIAELKQDKSTNASAFARVMSENRIRTNSVSKYCLGVTHLFPEVKQNNFKPKLLTLNKILYANA